MKMGPNVLLKPFTPVKLSIQPGAKAKACPQKRPKLHLKVHASNAQDVPPSNGSGQSTPVRGNKPLKINTDLKVYESRRGRIIAGRIVNPERKKEALAESERSFRDVLQKDPSDGRAYVGLGKLLLKQRRFDEARKLYEEGCAATEGSNPFIWTAWANLEAKCGFPPTARKYYDAALVANGFHQAAWHGWGMLEEREGHYERARDLWIKGVRSAEKHNKDPSEYLYCSLAMMACRCGKYSEARQWFKTGTSSARGFQSFALWHAWGKMEAYHGIKTAAPKLFRQALKINPRCRYTHLTWALLEKARGQIETARKLLMRANSLNAADPIILQAWGVMEGEEGNLAKAREIFKSGTELAPDAQELWQAWGVMEAREHNYDDARDIFQRGIWVDPNSASAAYIFQAWGIMEEELRNFESARKLFKAGVEADKTNMKLWDCWAESEEALGYYQRANEIRNLAGQNIAPTPGRTFTTLTRNEPAFEPIIEQVSDWFQDMRRPKPKIRRQSSAENPATDVA